MRKHRCFEIEGNDGTRIVIRGDPDMSDETKEALRMLSELAVEHVMTKDYGPNWREQFPDYGISPEQQPREGRG